MGFKGYFVAIVLSLFAGCVGGLAGGLISAQNADIIKARHFVLVDDTGAPRAVLEILPEAGDVRNCKACDGKVHFITTDRAGNVVSWPPTSRLDQAALQTLSTLGLMVSK
jgi:hypothetical protein